MDSLWNVWNVKSDIRLNLIPKTETEFSCLMEPIMKEGFLSDL